MIEAPTFRLEGLVKVKQSDPEDFEGPLDLILDLLKRNKIELRDLKIALLLEQYLAWMDKRSSMDLEIASDFIAMASHLVYLKTRMLLSVGDEPDEEVDELILALEERMRQEKLQRARIGQAFLERQADIGRNTLIKPPETLDTDKTYTYRHEAEDLRKALMELYERAGKKRPPPPSVFSAVVGREPYPVGEKVKQILRRLLSGGKMLLRALLSGAESRSEAVASFLAVLELCRGRQVVIEDTENGYALLISGEYENGKF